VLFDVVGGFKDFCVSPDSLTKTILKVDGIPSRLIHHADYLLIRQRLARWLRVGEKGIQYFSASSPIGRLK